MCVGVDDVRRRQKRANIDVTFPEGGDKVSYNTWYSVSLQACGHDVRVRVR
jgi:hypothetical protein